MTTRKLSIVAGVSYIIIFFAAIFANFFVLETLIYAPLETVENNRGLISTGIIAFLITVVFDVVVAWALFELFKAHILTRLSTYFRLLHAVIMGIAIYALCMTLKYTTDGEILAQVEIFNTIWLIGLFFFGIHLIILATILKKPKLIALFLILAGIMYMIDTLAHFSLKNYTEYSDVFLALVAIPSILGEMAFAIWLLIKNGKQTVS